MEDTQPGGRASVNGGWREGGPSVMLDMARPAWFDHRVTALSPDVMTLRTELHALRRAAVLMAERIAMEWSDKFNDDAKVVLEDYGLTPEQAEACIKAPNHG